MDARRIGAAVVLCALFQGAAPAAAEEPGRIALTWAILRRDAAGATSVLGFSAAGGAAPAQGATDAPGLPTAKSGDGLRVHIETAATCWIYLLLLDSGKELSLIHPASARAKGPVPAGEVLQLPGPNQWFILDANRGVEEFQLIVSAERLAPLEARLEAWARTPRDAEAKARVLDELKLVRRERGGLSSAVEKGVPVAGSFKTRGQEAAGLATSVEAVRFYAKTLRVAHD